MQQPALALDASVPASASASILSELDIQASLCLLQMQQRTGDLEESHGGDKGKKSKKTRPNKGSRKPSGQQHGVLQRALWKADQADNDDDLDNDQEVLEEGDDASSREFLRRNTQLSTMSRELSLEELRSHFGKPIVEVAREFGICTTFLKKICRRCGIKRWPHRQIRSLTRTIQMLRQAEANTNSPQEKQKFAHQIEQLEAKKQAVIENPDANSKLDRVKKSLVSVQKNHNKQRLGEAQSTQQFVENAPTKAIMSRGASTPLNALGVPAIMTTETATETNENDSKMDVDMEISSPNSVSAVCIPSSPHPDAFVTAASDENCSKLLLDMRISPSHRKSLQEVKVL